MGDTVERKTILVVDDTPANIDLLGGILDGEYRIKAALNGEKALKVVAKKAPDLILLDVLMPGMDGYEVCQRLKSDPTSEKIPVIFVTGKSADQINEQEHGVEGIVTKPIDAVVLKSMIERCF